LIVRQSQGAHKVLLGAERGDANGLARKGPHERMQGKPTVNAKIAKHPHKRSASRNWQRRRGGGKGSDILRQKLPLYFAEEP
jgi:hypothetical protein